MPNGEAVPVLGWVVVPLLCAAGAAVAAVLHYGAAVRHDAADTPNLPTAVIGGAVAGFAAAIIGLVVWHTMPMRSIYPVAAGVLVAGLGGEYVGGRTDSVGSALRAGAIAALDGLEKWGNARPDVVFAVGICRVILDAFGDTHRMNVRGFTESGGSRDELAALETLFAEGQHVRLGNQLLAAAPNVIRFGRESGPVGPEARYLLANLSTVVAGERVAEHLRAADLPLPSDREAEPYPQFLYTAAQAERTRRRGVPCVLVASLPKSASEFLCSTLAEATGAAVGRVTVGDPLLGTVYSGGSAKRSAAGA